MLDFEGLFKREGIKAGTERNGMEPIGVCAILKIALLSF